MNQPIEVTPELEHAWAMAAYARVDRIKAEAAVAKARAAELKALEVVRTLCSALGTPNG